MTHARALTFLAIPFGDMLVFGVLAAAGIHYRRRSDVHKRLMFLPTISILGAAFVRWPLAIMANGPRAFFATTDLFIVGWVCSRPRIATTPAPVLGRIAHRGVAAAAAGDCRHGHMARIRPRDRQLVS